MNTNNNHNQWKMACTKWNAMFELTSTSIKWTYINSPKHNIHTHTERDFSIKLFMNQFTIYELCVLGHSRSIRTFSSTVEHYSFCGFHLFKNASMHVYTILRIHNNAKISMSHCSSFWLMVVVKGIKLPIFSIIS